MTEPNKMSDDFELRFCPLCGHSARGRKEQFEHRLNCPNCKANVRFFDYPNDTPREPPITAPVDTKWYYLMLSVVVLAAIALLVIAILLIAGQAFTAALVAMLVFSAGLLLIGYALDRQSRLANAQTELRNGRELRKYLFDAVQNWRGFERNFDSLVQRHELEFKHREAGLDAQFEAQQSDIKAQLVAIAEQHDAVQTVATKYLKDFVHWTNKGMSSSNYATSKQRIEKAIEFC